MHVDEVGDERRNESRVGECGAGEPRRAVVHRPHAVEEVRDDARTGSRGLERAVERRRSSDRSPRPRRVRGGRARRPIRGRLPARASRAARDRRTCHTRVAPRPDRCDTGGRAGWAPGAPPRNGPSRWTPSTSSGARPRTAAIRVEQLVVRGKRRGAQREQQAGGAVRGQRIEGADGVGDGRVGEVDVGVRR